MVLDFTLQKYEELCAVLREKNTYTVQQYLKEKPSSNLIILRHDVDRKILNALKMAEIESKYGIFSTYYFRFTNKVYVPDLIKKINNLGHEIGYHYEVLSKKNGNYVEAKKMFEYELNEFRKYFEVNTIAMHGSPMSKYNNIDLWKVYDFNQYKLVGDAILSVNDVEYITDTGRSWNSKYNLRDKIINTTFNKNDLKNTNDLISYIGKENDLKLYLNIHPERWAFHHIEWCISYLVDNIYNIGKLIMRNMYE